MDHILLPNCDASEVCELLDEEGIENEFLYGDRILVDANSDYAFVLDEAGIRWEIL